MTPDQSETLQQAAHALKAAKLIIEASVTLFGETKRYALGEIEKAIPALEELMEEGVLPPNEEIMALADFVDDENLTEREIEDHDKWTPEQKKKYAAAVNLRRYAGMFGQNGWRIFAPHGRRGFCGQTFEGAVKNASRYAEYLKKKEQT